MITPMKHKVSRALYLYTTFFKNIVGFFKTMNGQFSIQSKDGNQDSLLHLMGFFERDEKSNIQGQFYF